MHGCTKPAVLLLIAGLAAAACAHQRATEPSQPAPEQVRAADQPEFADADALLTALEDADEGLVSLTARVRYDRIAIVQNDHQVYLGRLYFITGNQPAAQNEGEAQEPTPKRRFAIHFDSRIADEIMRNEESTYIFDGEWLVEKNATERLFIKRQVVPPGESFDPLRIGDGPMPLPIGQKKADILARYTAELLDPFLGLEPPADPLPEELAEAGAQAKFVEGAHQIRLVPRPGLPDEEFKEIRLWYSRGRDGNLLPRMARTVNRTGDISLVRLIDVQVQMQEAPENAAAQVPASVLDTATPQGWHVQVMPWRGATGASAPIEDDR